MTLCRRRAVVVVGEGGVSLSESVPNELLKCYKNSVFLRLPLS